MQEHAYDAIVVGSGPNGFSAAIRLAEQGRSVLVVEGAETIGGGTRSGEITLPGFTHDICSAIHSLAMASPYLRTLPLDQHGLELLHPVRPLAHPFDDGSAAVLERSLDATVAALGPDGRAYRRLMEPLVDHAEWLAHEILGPLRFPRHPLFMARFGLRALRSAAGLARSLFDTPRARALLGGLAAHSMLSLEQVPTGGFGIGLAAFAHAYGWPVVRGGSQNLANALASYFTSLGGEIKTGTWVRSLDELPRSRAVLFDVTPRQLVVIARDALPERYRRALGRYRYGAGVFKMDWALSEAPPWKADECREAAVVHIGTTLEELIASESSMGRGTIPDRPYVLLVQQSVVDPSRAPHGQHTVWAYSHVPHGSTIDISDRIEAQIERVAPGFKDCVIGRSVITPAELERHNPNCVGGDIDGGIRDVRQLFTRPVVSRVPYATPNPRIFICSSSTPPGGGVHGMSGFFAAEAALKRVLA